MWLFQDFSNMYLKLKRKLFFGCITCTYLIHSFTNCFIHSFIHSLIHPSIHSPINTTVTHFQLLHTFLQSLSLSNGLSTVNIHHQFLTLPLALISVYRQPVNGVCLSSVPEQLHGLNSSQSDAALIHHIQYPIKRTTITPSTTHLQFTIHPTSTKVKIIHKLQITWIYITFLWLMKSLVGKIYIYIYIFFFDNIPYTKD